jgi:hypothetical protein
MHHHRLTLNGPSGAVARLADDLAAAGAVAVPVANDGAPRRLVWPTRAPATLEQLCGRHRAVVVGVERFELLGDELQRLVLHGREATVLERRRLVPDPELLAADDGCEPAGSGCPPAFPGGLCLDEDGAPLDVAALRAAAHRIAALPVDLGPGLAGSSLDDALLLGAALGHLCAAATATDSSPHPLGDDPRAHDVPSPAVLAAVTSLAASALTASAACTGAACPAELAHERAYRLTASTAAAATERLWARPGAADWPEWLMYLLAGTATVIDDCAACLHQPAPPFLSVHAEHHATDEERLEHAAGRLVSTCLQALVLFDAGPSP